MEATELRRVASGECVRSDGVVNPLHLAVSVTLRPREIAIRIDLEIDPLGFRIWIPCRSIQIQAVGIRREKREWV